MARRYDSGFDRKSLFEMAPRFRVMAETMPDYVSQIEKWQHKAREYTDLYIRPKALEIDRKCHHDPAYFDWDLVKKSTRYGFLSMLCPEAVGGGGQLATAFSIVMEEMCSACSGIANIYGASGLGISGMLLGLDFYFFDTVLADIAEGDRKGKPVICAAAITEPSAGSDVEDAEYIKTARMMTEAKKVRGGFMLNGRKVFISNGSVAKYTNVISPLDRKRPFETQSSFIVRKGDRGFSVGRIEEKMGMKACPAAELVFEDCFIKKKDLMGRGCEGVRFTEIVLGASRGPVGAIATGVARGAFEKAVEFAQKKKWGGRRLIDQQWVQIKLADMARRIHVSRQMYLDAAMQFDFFGIPKLMKSPPTRFLLDVLPSAVRNTDLFTKAIRSPGTYKLINGMIDKEVSDDDLSGIQEYSSMAKITGSDTAVQIAYEALQIAGIESSLQKYELEKIYRDAKLTQIYEGTNQLNRHNVFVNYFKGENGYAD